MELLVLAPRDNLEAHNVEILVVDFLSGQEPSLGAVNCDSPFGSLQTLLYVEATTNDVDTKSSVALPGGYFTSLPAGLIFLRVPCPGGGVGSGSNRRCV